MTPRPADGLRVTLAAGVRDAPAAAWDALLGPDASPFESHAWLAALEARACVGPGTGFLPRPALAWRGEALVGACAAYDKDDVQGELVDDAAWHLAAAQAGLPSYPKRALTSPFASAQGPRLLAHPALPPAERAAVKAALLDALVADARARGLRAVQLLHTTDADADAARERGFVVTLGLHHRFRNAPPYASFEAFLARFRSHRRNQIRRERHRVGALDLRTRTLAGAAIDEDHLEIVAAMQQAAQDRFLEVEPLVGMPHLLALRDALGPWLELILAEHAGRPVAAALNVVKDGVCHGRYWGSALEVDALYFEVCGYATCERAIQAGLDVVDVGPGGLHHKERRGFLAETVPSAVLAFDDAVGDALREHAARERERARDIAQKSHRVFIR
ncbi:MAG: GNAT family N-acetyltransferase [Myxococcales bacterium]|nr:GNAT family N-acetyltransferase [Myxococcales bacterium]MCB9735661.1 GNAT family N-acetyltransferase [Deltaproteobacteria bacterium]